MNAYVPSAPVSTNGSSAEICKDQPSSVPVSQAIVSVIWRVHVPPESSPSNPDKRPSGRNEPENGAVASAIDSAASSSSVVSVKLAPAPPTAVNSSTLVPEGLTRYASRSALYVWVMSSVTLRSAIATPSWIVSVDATVPLSGMPTYVSGEVVVVLPTSS